MRFFIRELLMGLKLQSLSLKGYFFFAIERTKTICGFRAFPSIM